MDGSRSGNDVGSCHADDDGDRAAILAGNQTPTKKRKTRIRVRVQRRLGAVAQPYRSTGAPPKRLAAQSLRRSPKGRVGGPNATTTILRPRSQGGIASGVAIVRRNRRQRRGRGLPLPPSLHRSRGGKTYLRCPLTEGSGVDPEGPKALPSTGPH